MKSCENCALFLNGCPGLDGCDFENCGYKPDYPTLEAENAELKQRISELERISNDSINCSVALVVGNTRLKQELEVHKKMLEIARGNMFCVFCNLIKNCKQHCDEGCQGSLLDEARKELAK